MAFLKLFFSVTYFSMTTTLKLVILISVLGFDSSVVGNTLCAFFKKDNVQYKKVETALEDDGTHQHSNSEPSIDSNNTEHCSKDSDSCYALWQEDPINRTIVIVTQGCWDSSGSESCGLSECIANKKPSKALNNSKFCCCSGNFCNINVTDGYISVPSNSKEDLNPALQYVEPIPYESSTIAMIAVVAMTLFTILAIITYYLYRFYFYPPKRNKEALHLMESATPPPPSFDFDSLKIQEPIGHGRYGTVCRGKLHDHPIAIKIFSHQNKQYYLNERDIYTLPHLEHPSILKFIGSEERTDQDGRPEYLLVLSFLPIGCLQDYLRNNTLDWFSLCKMASSIACGLAHLHTEFGKGEKLKPCVAHRDLTSRNILMKTDGSCMLCDFGFAIRVSGSKYYQNGEEKIAETTSLPDVGTLRYMSPEILEGAVNLRDCESSLKQIDVYALGLIMWEISTRCIDLYQGMEVPEYKLPFEAEVGIHPTMEQMQVLVTRHKARPLFPYIWKDMNPAVRSLTETIEDCWDQDAEARLTTLCVEERLAELPAVWERCKAGLVGLAYEITPTVNPTSNQRMSIAVNKMQNNNVVTPTEALSNEDMPLFIRERAYSLSGGTTETLLSPSESGARDATFADNDKNNAIISSEAFMPLQPHQGHNPCLERNLMLESLAEDTVSGNTLVEKSAKVSIDTNFHSFSDGDADTANLSIFDNSSLVSNDLLSHSIHICNGIPHQSNDTYTSTPPNQPNVPGNVSCLGQVETFRKSKEEIRWGPMDFFDRKIKIKKDGKTGLKNLLEKNPLIANSKEVPEEQQPLNEFLGSFGSPNSPIENKLCQMNNITDVTSDINKRCDHAVDTEVRVKKSNSSSIIVRPINNMHSISNEDSIVNVGSVDKKVMNKNALSIKLVHNDSVIRTDKLVMDNEITPINKNKRPNSLPLQELYNVYLDNNEDIEKCDGEILNDKSVVEQNTVQAHRKNSGKRKGVKRVKTPFEIKGRFSLYDDRIMSSHELSAAYSKETVQPIFGETAKFSTSVPLDMNTLCSSKLTNSMNDTKDGSIKSENQKLNGLKVPVSVSQLQIIHSLCDI